MTSKELRQKFLEFFKKNGHKIAPSSSLLPTDPSVLFTTAGMQQFKQYFLGEKSPYGKNVASCQKCLRTSDIDEVGDERHLTFFEMLGNFSFGGYGKKEAIKLAKDFLDSINIKIDYVSIFSGENGIAADEESEKIWKTIDSGIIVKKLGKADNFWGPTGQEGPCGPTTEIYSGGIEVWNLVFNDYYQDKNKNLTELSLRGVDTGMGLERLAMVSQGKSNVFETDLFSPIIFEIKEMMGVAKIKTPTSPAFLYPQVPAPYSIDQEMEKLDKRMQISKYLREMRIIADHIKGSVFLISEGISPSNAEQGYVLRRVLRRAIRYGKLLNLPRNFLISLAQKVIEIYNKIYPELKSQEADILTVIQKEEEKFFKTLEMGLREIKKASNLTGEVAFRIYETYGFPLELTEEIRKVDDRDAFFSMQKKHREISRAGAEKKFGGGGEFSPKLHTATHLLHAALREVLGKHVQQMGSDITPQRLRFDFSHPQKMTGEEVKRAEDLVNQKIKENLEVKKEEIIYEEAVKSGALAFFKEKYPERVNVYSVKGFSREICAGPHVSRTGELGHLEIIKEESSGAGIRRIRAILE